MSKFVIVSNKDEISIPSNWVDSAFPSWKDSRFVDEKGGVATSTYQGKLYEIVSEKVRYFSTAEKVGRRSLVVLLAFCTLGLALLSKKVQKLFTKIYEKVRFGVLSEKTYIAEYLKGPIKPEMVSSIKIFKSETKNVGRPYDGDLTFADSDKNYHMDMISIAEAESLVKAFPSKVQIMGERLECAEEVKLEGAKVLKYLGYRPGPAHKFD